MDIAFGALNDCLHEIGDRGYEWWYYDISSDDGEYAIVCIFFRNTPMLPACIEGIKSKSHKSLTYDGISVSVYHKKKKIAQKLLWSNKHTTTYNKRDVGDYEIRFDVSYAYHKNGGYNIHCDLKNGQDSRRIYLEATMENTAFLKSNSMSLNTMNHAWLIITPRARANVSLQIYDDDTLKVHKSFVGRAYHDHNFSQLPVFEEFDDWYWGRAIFSEFTLIYYYIPASSKYKTEVEWVGLFADSNDSAIVLRDVRIHKQNKRMNYSGLSYHSSIIVTGFTDKDEYVECSFSQSDAAENGPFYMRFLSHCTLKFNGSILYDNDAFSEYFCARRLNSRLVRLLTQLPWEQV